VFGVAVLVLGFGYVGKWVEFTTQHGDTCAVRDACTVAEAELADPSFANPFTLEHVVASIPYVAVAVLLAMAVRYATYLGRLASERCCDCMCRVRAGGGARRRGRPVRYHRGAAEEIGDDDADVSPDELVYVSRAQGQKGGETLV